MYAAFLVGLRREPRMTMKIKGIRQHLSGCYIRLGIRPQVRLICHHLVRPFKAFWVDYSCRAICLSGLSRRPDRLLQLRVGRTRKKKIGMVRLT